MSIISQYRKGTKQKGNIKHMKIFEMLRRNDYLNASLGTNTGKMREKNEDNYYFDGTIQSEGCVDEHIGTSSIKINNTNGTMFAIFDGVGGERGGEVASLCAARGIKNYLKNNQQFSNDSVDEMLDRLTQHLNQEVYDEGMRINIPSMGTTIAALYFLDDAVWSCNVGDSRCYRFRNGVLKQLSVDHDEDMFSSDFNGRKGKARLIQYLGMNPKDGKIEPYISKNKWNKDDIFLICSDGLTDMVEEPDIADTLRIADSTERAVKELIDLALENGGKDNVSVIVCKI